MLGNLNSATTWETKNQTVMEQKLHNNMSNKIKAKLTF